MENNTSKKNIGRFLYFDWLIPIVDYFSTLKKKEYIFDIIGPIVIAIGVVSIYNFNNLVNNAISKMGNILPTVLAVLIGFTISSIAIIITSSDEKMNKIEKFNRELSGEKISLYQYILIILIYVLIQEIINLILVFFIGFVSPLIKLQLLKNIALGLYVFYILHILAIILRAVIEIYTTNYKKD